MSTRKGPDAMDYNYYLLCKYDLTEGIVRTKVLTAAEADAAGIEDVDVYWENGVKVYVDGFYDMESLQHYIDSLTDAHPVE